MVYERYIKKEKPDIISTIPQELVLHIIKFCDGVTLTKFSECSTFFNKCILGHSKSLQENWEYSCRNDYPYMYENMQEPDVDWKTMYILRTIKQQIWDAAKHKPAKAKVQDSTKQSGRRQKTCKRCHERFTPASSPHLNPPCAYHPGIFAHKTDCSTCTTLNDNKSVPKEALDERIQRKLRHKTKTGTNYTFISVHGECQFAYTCCEKEASGAAGCKQGVHK
eukprot:Phypoly_transcript_15165.p1 GENE.Phypoly_transcript_15165~~Phypoly_transcript_15165.p1  ORF type:complete len:222 (+),score=21.21 Phypoly_transcript_15165:229-894(+)